MWCYQAPTSSAAVSASSGTPVSKRLARPSFDELAASGEAVARGDRRRPERIRATPGLAVGRNEVADVGARVADRTHLPVEHCGHPLRLLVGDHHVPEAIIAVDDGCRQLFRNVRGEPVRDVDHLGQVARLVHLPELREPAYLARVVVPRSLERGQPGRGHVGRMDLDECVDEVVRQSAPRSGIAVQWRRQLCRDHVSVDVVHDVERNAEQGIVLAHGAAVRDADPERCERELQPRLAHDVVRRRRQRWPWRSSQHVSRPVFPLEQEGEVRATALADAARL